jgi:hypothetical protein
MPLATLHYRFVGSQAFTAGSISGCLDAIYTLGGRTTYANGTTRTPGSGSAWTWTRQQIGGITEACIGAMPAANALNMRFIVAGSTTSRAYTVLAPDAATISNVLVQGMNRGSATLTGNWYDAQPFGSGNVGYWRASLAFTNAQAVAYMWESEETYVIQVGITGSSTFSACGGGAFLDPKDTGSPAAETDGRLYGQWSTGSTEVIPASFLTNYFLAGGGGMMTHYTGSARGHHCVLLPASTTAVMVSRMVIPGGTAAMPAGQQNPNGKLVMVEDVPFNQANSTVWGAWRAMAYTRLAITGQVWRLSGAEKGYFVGGSASTAQDGILLLAN